MAQNKDVESIKGFLDDLWKQAQGMLAKGRRKTEEVAHTAQLKMDLYIVSSKKRDLYQQLGEYFFLSSRRKKPSAKIQQRLLAIIQEIRDIEMHEKGLRKVLKKGPRAAGKKRGRPAGAKKRGRPAGVKKAARRGRPRSRKPAPAKTVALKGAEKPTS
jgi:hypothetical protein